MHWDSTEICTGRTGSALGTLGPVLGMYWEPWGLYWEVHCSYTQSTRAKWEGVLGTLEYAWGHMGTAAA